MSQLQQQITSFISTAKVDKLSAKNTNNAEESAFTEKNGDKQNIINPAKRLHSCLSSSSDHSICIENELDEIKQSLKNVPKKSDLTEIVTEIFKSLSENLKKQIKKEIMSEVKSEVEKLKTNYDSKISHLHDKLNTIEFENGNLLEKNASLHSDLRKMREVVDENNKKATESVRLGNWNEQYSRKKNVKIYHLPENRNEDLPHSLLNELKNQVKLDINPSEVVAMHRIPGKEGNPRPVLIKFLRMDTKISLLRKKKAINEALKVRIGDDITKLNQGLLNRLYQHDNVISSWYFNGHVYGSDEEGTRHRSIIQFLLLVAGIEQNPGPDQSNKKNLKIVHNNVCSLLPKLDLINNELHDYDIICISESHLDKSITDDQIKLNGFHKPIRLDRNRHGGGVTIYIKNSLHFIIRNDISVSNLELLWVEVRNCSNEKFLVGVLYRPPNSNSNLWDLFSESVDKALDCNLPIFLCGDFNCDMMSNSIEISFKTFKQHSFKRQIRDFKRADYEGLKNQLNDTDWDDVVFNSNNINDVYMNFVKTFESTVNRYIPTKTITVRPNDKPFMNNLIRNKIRHRNRIHHKAKTSNNPDHWKKFREIRNEIISLVRKAKDDYKCKLTSQLIDKNIPPGKWWRIAKSVSNFTKNRDSPPFLEHDGQIFIHPLDKSEILNNHFADIANIDIEPEIPDNNEPPPCHLNKFVITEKEILDQLKILNVNKPAGPDGISPRILKEVASFISKPLTKLFNMSLSVKQVPLRISQLVE
ncbi:unnamed protein product [Mytilus edulis]|uniref:Endonuclease/exonuclease/phosphatase domain-containing protein n=1 Tax=Mytilus edulis TaxID=6550 RepID=A0A8S3U7Y4_MYTED|nr:unnamed protein product [Mytilus edulis]